jgi:deoxyribonuclease-4
MYNYYGSHLSINNSLLNTLILAKNTYKSTSVQVFISNPQSGRITKSIYDKYKQQSNSIRSYLNNNNMQLVIHAPYIFNFSRDPTTENPYWINELWRQLCISQMIGSIGCVLHMGKYSISITNSNNKKTKIKLDEKIAQKNMINSLSIIIDKMHSLSMTTKLILETSAGCGSELYPTENNSIEPLINLWNSFSTLQQSYIGFCIDTCHIHSAGYSISSKKNIDKFFDDWDKSIGIHNISLIHLNNSITEYNSHVDRHGTLFSGTIPNECLLHFAYKAFDYNIVTILETIASDPTPEIEELIKLSSIIQPSNNYNKYIQSDIDIPDEYILNELYNKQSINNIEHCSCSLNNEIQTKQEFNVNSSNKLLLIDLGYLFHYRYHATKKNLSFSKKELDDKTIHDAFFSHLDSQLSKIIKKFKLSYNDIFFCKDDRKHNFWRIKLYPDYKANRGIADDLCIEWQNELYNFVKKYGNFLELPDSEADDIIYLSINNIIKLYPNKNIYIFASDKDYLQVLDRPSIYLLDGAFNETVGTSKGDARLSLWTKILSGDNSDNIPPIFKGCGTKTSIKMINDINYFNKCIEEYNCIDQLLLNRNLVSFDHIPQKYIELFNNTYSFI